MAQILVVAEQQAGQLKKSTLVAVTLAKQIGAKIGGGFDLLVLGSGVSAVTEALQGYGAEAIHVADAPSLEHYLAQPYVAVVADAVIKSGAAFVIAPAATFGKDLLPRVAARLGAGMVADCIGLADGAALAYKRPMYAGNVVATVKVNTPKTVITARPAAFDAAQKTGGSSKVETLAVGPAVGGARFVDYVITESERPELNEADVVVSGGRGLKDGASFWSVMNPLADAFGAAIGATRAVVDSFPEVPNDMQVGQTGKVVAPNLYIAVALSGAIQHLAGMKNSKTIVAINKDADAPIFQVADYGLVGDAFKLVPELAAKVKAARS